ncbi:beta-galactosidase [Kineococcus sp. R8]|uniref:beta-galactosidase n=1 Tax=Kineococcus siccus TaxID=2696567 RepID=UPI001411EAFF|nr:beta-galactosidase [Kineococcus siccus]NAZ81615.1 beta-galactosidase [Kineococcus siccus]
MSQRSAPFAPGRLLFGGDYNPEQWPREVWDEDVRLMRAAGTTTATVGVFSWSVLEPRPGEFTFDWLDEVFDLLHRNGIGVVLATPTASPPPWFSSAHPDALPVEADGTRKVHGSRDTYCHSAPAYRAACVRIATALAERYGRHPALQAWHLHNEYGTLCWCDHVAAAFRDWLRERYGTLEALNDAWWTAFWSQRCSTWEEVLPPRATQYLHNPTQAVDFRRFSSDAMLERLREQREAVRAAGSTAPVTTNFMLPTWNHLEQWSWAAEQDVVSLDHYLDDTGPDGEAFVAYAGDLARSWAGGGPWLLMEQSPTSVPLRGRRATRRPGEFTRHSLSYVARGAQGAMYFQWRAPSAGSEAWHGAVLDHAGADTRLFREACSLGAALGRLAEVAEPPAEGRTVLAEVAVLWHADGWWALEHQVLPSDAMTYPEAVRDVHRSLHGAGIAVDFARPGADLRAYRLVVVPSMYVLGDAAVRSLQEFVEAGGVLVVGCLTGYAAEDLHVVGGGYPGRLRDLLGVRVDELHPLAEEEPVALSGGSRGHAWSEHVEPGGAETVLTYESGSLAGGPAATRARSGAGTAHYLSTRLRGPDLDRYLADRCAEAGVEPVLGRRPPAGVEVVRRRGARTDYLFVLNHAATPVLVTGPGEDLLSGRASGAGLTVAGGDVAVLRQAQRGAADPWTVVAADEVPGALSPATPR